MFRRLFIRRLSNRRYRWSLARYCRIASSRFQSFDSVHHLRGFETILFVPFSIRGTFYEMFPVRIISDKVCAVLHSGHIRSDCVSHRRFEQIHRNRYHLSVASCSKQTKSKVFFFMINVSITKFHPNVTCLVLVWSQCQTSKFFSSFNGSFTKYGLSRFVLRIRSETLANRFDSSFNVCHL